MALPRQALVLGFQRTGQAVARVLAARGVRVRVADRRPAEALGVETRQWMDIELRLGEEGPDLLAGMDLVVPSPGVPREAPLLAAALRRGLPVHSEIEMAAGLLACPVVAITGTNGKSTTTSLVGLALARAGRRAFVGGNLGTPLIAAVGTDADVAVAEVSSFQLEWVEQFRPRVGCLINLTPDHLDRHGSFESYAAAKARLFARQQAEDFAVLNRDDAVVWRVAEHLGSRRVSFGAAPVPCGAFAGEGYVALRLPGAGEERYDLARTRLVGRHNLENVLAAVTVARLAGAPPRAVQEAIDAFEPLPHRMTRVAARLGVDWFDDSKATNVGAAVKSLESFPPCVVLLAGGVDKGGSYAPLADAAAGKVRVALVFGAARDAIAAALAARDVAVEHVPSLEAAVRAAAVHARPGDVVLLAPACSSFDMFADYAARGRAFRAAIEALG